MTITFQQKCRCVLRAVCFLLILSLILSGLSFLLQPKGNRRSDWIQNPNARGFYGEPHNSLDILVIGNSDVYSGYSPMELWNAYGYTSYACSEGSQTLAEAVNILREALTNQHPKLVILETDSIFYNRKIATRLDDTTADFLEGKLPVFRYHNLWKINSPSKMLQTPEYTVRRTTKGQKLSNRAKGYSGKDYWKKTSRDRWIPLSAQLFLDQFVDICRENDIDLLLMEIPSASSWTETKHNLVKAYADQNNIPFLDLDQKQDEFDFDWTTDSRDGGNHLNSQGAKKLTLYLGQYLSRHYDLADKRDNDAYALWNEDYQRYLDYLSEK